MKHGNQRENQKAKWLIMCLEWLCFEFSAFSRDVESANPTRV